MLTVHRHTSASKHGPMNSLLCSWPGCSKSTPFKTLKLLETHLENIHVNPLVCTQPGCPYNRPFPKKGDFDRHLASRHGIGRLFRCPDRTCPRHKRPFGRKDKLREHVNKYRHGTCAFSCQFDHCIHNDNNGGLLSQEDVSKHQETHHGLYECAIGDCEGSNSRFSQYELKLHLSYNHNVMALLLEDLQKQGKTTVTSADVTGLDDKYFVFFLIGVGYGCYGCGGHSRKFTA
jgi:general transcription factor IIIA